MSSDYEPGTKIFAKMKGYPHWPARIDKLQEGAVKPAKGKFPIFFYGTHETAFLGPKDIYLYEKYKHKYHKENNRPEFNAGLWEIIHKPDVAFQPPMESEQNGDDIQDSEDKEEQIARVACLSGLAELETIAKKHDLKMSVDTFRYVLKNLGPSQSQNLISKYKHQNFTKPSLKKHVCFICGFTTLIEEDLRTHINTIHTKLKTHLCSICGFSTAFKSRLKRHIECVHKKLKPYKCLFCSFTAARKESLKPHFHSIHNKLHKCDTCDYATYNKSSLKIHIDDTHNNKIKPHKCNICNFRTAKKVYLKQHINSIHNQLKPHKCHICSYTTSKKSHLTRHIDSRHKKLKPYKCHQCDFTTSRKESLKLHRAANHSDFLLYFKTPIGGEKTQLLSSLKVTTSTKIKNISLY